MRGDTEVVLAAVQENGSALKYASDALQADHAVVLAAVRNLGGALTFASEALQNDLQIVLSAVKQSSKGVTDAIVTLEIMEESKIGDLVTLAPKLARLQRAIRFVAHPTC